MTLLVGGTPRAGKSQLQKLLLDKYHIPGITTDIFRDGLKKAYPQLGLKEGMKDIDKSEILWPYFREILKQRDYYKDTLLIEGTNFLPKYLQEFKEKDNIRICFLGYTEIAHELKFSHIREFKSPEGDWTSDMSDEELDETVKGFLEKSEYFKTECAKYAIKYFDTSHNFQSVIEQAAAFLTSEVVRS